MKQTYYKFTNQDESYTGCYETLAAVLKDVSDFRTFRVKGDGGWYTRDGGYVERVEVEVC